MALCLHQAGLAALIYGILRHVECMLGALAGVRFIHHVLTRGFVLFIIVHIYLAFWHDIVFKEGTISSIVSGNLFEKVD